MPIDQNQTTKFWRPLAETLVGGAVLGFLTWICFQLELGIATAVPIYLIIILLLSIWGSLGPAIVLSVVAAECLLFFFTPPIFSFEVDRPKDIPGDFASHQRSCDASA